MYVQVSTSGYPRDIEGRLVYDCTQHNARKLILFLFRDFRRRLQMSMQQFSHELFRALIFHQFRERFLHVRFHHH